ncbi:MAG: hypothetical protein R3277_09310 [Brumimicrobium sp.]|nr:hypothetical protein [Brumimicrobium sp.]
MRTVFVNLFTLLMTVQVMFGSMGVLIYKHHCKKEGLSYSVFTASAHDRCGQKINKEDCPSEKVCCRKVTETNGPAYENSCCTSETEWYHLNTDLVLNSMNHFFLNDASFISGDDIHELIALEKTYAFNYRGPPQLITKKSQSLLQVYLI